MPHPFLPCRFATDAARDGRRPSRLGVKSYRQNYVARLSKAKTHACILWHVATLRSMEQTEGVPRGHAVLSLTLRTIRTASSGKGFPLQRVVSPSERLDVDMMQERSEPLLLLQPRGLPYAVEAGEDRRQGWKFARAIVLHGEQSRMACLPLVTL
jgi:hypothetical protein